MLAILDRQVFPPAPFDAVIDPDHDQRRDQGATDETRDRFLDCHVLPANARAGRRGSGRR